MSWRNRLGGWRSLPRPSNALRIAGTARRRAPVELRHARGGVTQGLKDQQRNARVGQQVGGDAPCGQRRVAGRAVRRQDDEIAPLSPRDLEKSLPLVAVSKDERPYGCSLALQLDPEALQVLLAADLQTIRQLPGGPEILRRTEDRGRDGLPHHEGEQQLGLVRAGDANGGGQDALGPEGSIEGHEDALRRDGDAAR